MQRLLSSSNHAKVILDAEESSQRQLSTTFGACAPLHFETLTNNLTRVDARLGGVLKEKEKCHKMLQSLYRAATTGDATYVTQQSDAILLTLLGLLQDVEHAVVENTCKTEAVLVTNTALKVTMDEWSENFRISGGEKHQFCIIQVVRQIFV